MSRRFSAVVPRVRSKRLVFHAVRHKSWQNKQFMVGFSEGASLGPLCQGNQPEGASMGAIL